MNKELDKLINPKWMQDMHRLNEKIRGSVLSRYDFPEMRAIQQAMKPITALNTFHNAELLKSARLNTSSLLLGQSTAIKAMNDIMEANSLPLSLMAIQNSPAFAIDEALKSFPDIGKAFRNISIPDPAIMQVMNFINTLPSFQKLATLENSPFTHFDLSSFDVDDEPNYDVDVSDFLIKVDHQICEEVNANTDFNALSDKTKNLIIAILKYFFAPLLVGILLIAIDKNWDEITAALPEFSTAAEVRKFSRNPDSKLDPELLKSYRIIKGHNVNLRDGPGMNADVIITLSMGTLVNVIDKPKTHKAWLLVEVKIDGELEQGWVARRYTEYFK